ncbi:MAG TPA: efflux RND transporter periplasmic adaptor subunit [Terriglobales bacterium]
MSKTALEVEERTHTATTPRPSNKGALRLVVVIVLVLLAGGAFAVVRRMNERKSVDQRTHDLATPIVSVIKPSIEPAADQLVLPGQLQAYTEAPLYARTNGYLLKWYKDIGSRVNKGDLLASIDTPEVDQELSQARAARQQAEAQSQLAKVSADRWLNLRKSDSVSQQEADQQTSGYAQAQANLAAASANVRRLEQLESFKRIYAPFSGVLTRRNTDIGQLVAAGSAGAGKELFDIAQVNPLRVYVSVPQVYAPSIKAGMKTTVDLEQYPGQKFEGKVVRSADAIDPTTRTLLTEVQLPNKDGKLLPGSYGQVHFAVPIQHTRMTVPINALLFRAEGPRAAVVGPDNKVHLKAVQIGRDFGTTVEIVNGLEQGDQIVVNPADSLEDNQPVKVKQQNGKDQNS